MNLWQWAAGTARIRLTCADREGALRELTRNGLELSDTVDKDALTVEFTIPASAFRKLQRLAKRKGWSVEMLEQTGLVRTIKGWMARPVLVVGLALILTASVYLPTRVLFVQVEGNGSVPTRQILEQAARCGIGFGASRREVRSQKMKDALLHAMPELQWAGVTTAGCTATITVRERAEEEQREEEQVSSLVASRDGIITSITAAQGTAKFTIGQAVKAGEVLISGYTDCGFCIRAQRAVGEIFARTERELTAVTPSQWSKTGEIQATEKKYALIIGKNRINFYKDSGNPGGVCDKIYSEYYVTLPGGFQLPVRLVTEIWTWADSAGVNLPEEAAADILSDFSGGYLAQEMTAGTVTDRREEVTEGEGIYCLTGNYACIEMIGRQRNEENLIGKYD